MTGIGADPLKLLLPFHSGVPVTCMTWPSYTPESMNDAAVSSSQGQYAIGA